MCHQLWPDFDLQRSYFLLALFCLCYLLPLMMIVVCYILIAKKVWKRKAPGVETNGRLIIYKSKVKVLKMLAVIVILFAFSWLPLYVVYLRLYFGEGLTREALALIFDIIVPVSQWLGSSNCSMNPIIYCFFSKKYRRGFRSIIYCKLTSLSFRRQSTRLNHSLSTRYMNVENSCSDVKNDAKIERKHEHRVSSNKFMVVAFSNGKMTVSFRKEPGSEESSF